MKRKRGEETNGITMRTAIHPIRPEGDDGKARQAPAPKRGERCKNPPTPKKNERNHRRANTRHHKSANIYVGARLMICDV